MNNANLHSKMNNANLQTYDLIYVRGKTFFSEDGFQNMFVDQPGLNKLRLKKDKGNDYMFLVGNQRWYMFILQI